MKRVILIALVAVLPQIQGCDFDSDDFLGKLFKGGGSAVPVTVEGVTIRDKDYRIKVPATIEPSKVEEITFPKELSGVLERAGIFSETEFASDQRVTLTAEKEGLKGEGKGPVGWFEEIIPFESKEVFSFSAHPEYIITAMDFGRKMVLGEKVLMLKGKNFTHVISI